MWVRFACSTPSVAFLSPSRADFAAFVASAIWRIEDAPPPSEMVSPAITPATAPAATMNTPNGLAAAAMVRAASAARTARKARTSPKAAAAPAVMNRTMGDEAMEASCATIGATADPSCMKLARALSEDAAARARAPTASPSGPPMRPKDIPRPPATDWKREKTASAGPAAAARASMATAARCCAGVSWSNADAHSVIFCTTWVAIGSRIWPTVMAAVSTVDLKPSSAPLNPRILASASFCAEPCALICAVSAA